MTMKQITIDKIKELIKRHEHKIENHYDTCNGYFINLKDGFKSSLNFNNQISGKSFKEIKYKMSFVTDEPPHPVKIIRIRSKLGQVNFAKLLRRTQSTISKYELNKLDLSRQDFSILNKELNVNINKLLRDLDQFDIDFEAWEKRQN